MVILTQKCPTNLLKGSNNRLTCLSAWILLKKCEKTNIGIGIAIIFTFRYRNRYCDYFCIPFSFAIGIAFGIIVIGIAIIFFCNFIYLSVLQSTLVSVSVSVSASVSVSVYENVLQFITLGKIWSNGRPIHYDPVLMGWGFRNKRQKQLKLITFQSNSYLFSSNLFLYWIIVHFGDGFWPYTGQLTIFLFRMLIFRAYKIVTQ